MELTFKELVKLIHPDVNPNVENVSEKMVTVLRNRNNPNELHRLAVQWGLITPDVSNYRPEVVEEEVVEEVERERPQPTVTEVNGATITVQPSMFGRDGEHELPAREPEWISNRILEEEYEREDRELQEMIQEVVNTTLGGQTQVGGWETEAIRRGWTPPEPQQFSTTEPPLDEQRPQRPVPVQQRPQWTPNPRVAEPLRQPWKLPAEEQAQIRRPAPNDLSQRPNESRREYYDRMEREGHIISPEPQQMSTVEPPLDEERSRRRNSWWPF